MVLPKENVCGSTRALWYAFVFVYGSWATVVIGTFASALPANATTISMTAGTTRARPRSRGERDTAIDLPFCEELADPRPGNHADTAAKATLVPRGPQDQNANP